MRLVACIVTQIAGFILILLAALAVIVIVLLMLTASLILEILIHLIGVIFSGFADKDSRMAMQSGAWHDMIRSATSELIGWAVDLGRGAVKRLTSLS